MNPTILYEWYKDIVFHVLTHMQVDNASNLFNEVYIQEVKQAKEKLGMKENLIQPVAQLQCYYTTNFSRLAMINFMPFMNNTFEELKHSIMHCPYFTQEDQENFIHTFVRLLEEEKTFFAVYWSQKDTQLTERKHSVEENLNNQWVPFQCLSTYYKKHRNKDITLILSYTMRQNGRGGQDQLTQIAAVPFPFNQEDEDNTFFMALHELTHPLTDTLVGQYISMEDGSHELTEKVVMVADYELIKEVKPELAQTYFKWICHKWGKPTEQLDEQIFYNLFSIPLEITEQLQLLIKEISQCQ